MRKHEEEKHEGEHVEFKVRILGSCPGDALLRQCMEAVVIRDKKPSMNGRAEWGTGKGRRKRKEPTNANNNNMEQTNERGNNNGVIEQADNNNGNNPNERATEEREETEERQAETAQEDAE